MRVSPTLPFAVACLLSLPMRQSALAQTPAYERARAIAGLYRIEPASDSNAASVKFLRLRVDGRARVETVGIETTGSVVASQVSVGSYRKDGWYFRTLDVGSSPQFCLSVPEVRGCFNFHVQMPGANVPLYGPDATLGEPTILLRRQRE
jgi:hypothetical protein